MSATNTTPIHARITAYLRGLVESGELGDGDLLPGENALMVRYDVARMTARQAIATLCYEGLAVAVKGSGTYVRSKAPGEDASRALFFDALDALHLDPGSGQFYDRESGVVDMGANTIVRALLAAGWTPPSGSRS